MVLMTKLAEYVSHIDRNAGRTGGKTAFVVQNEIIAHLAAGGASAAEDLTLSQLALAASPSNNPNNSSGGNGLTRTSSFRSPTASSSANMVTMRSGGELLTRDPDS